MVNDDKKTIDYIFENYDDLTWTDVNVLINELSDITKSYIYQHIINNPTPKMKLASRDLLRKIENKRKKKVEKEYQYKCCHLDCNEPAIQSHVISKNAILSSLANLNNEIYYFSPDIESNPYECTFKSKNIRSTSTFPGYCESHDENIFREIDQGVLINNKYVSLNVMRVLKKEIFDLKLKVSLQEEQQNEWDEIYCECIKKQESIDLIKLDEANDFFVLMRNKLEAIKVKINKYELLYDGIYNDIQNATKIKYEVVEVKYIESCFSAVIDIPLENGNDGEPHFISYTPINGKGYIIIAKENNGSDYDPMIVEENGKLSVYFWMFILGIKETIYFSENVINIISEYQRRMLHTNYQYFEVTALEAIMLSSIYI